MHRGEFMKDVISHDQCCQAVRESVNASWVVGRRERIGPDNVEPRVHLRNRQRMERRARQSQRRQIIRMRYLTRKEQMSIKQVGIKLDL